MLKNTIIKKSVFTLITMATMLLAAVAVNAGTLEDVILKGVNANQEQIDVSGLNVAPQDAVNAYINLKHTNPDMFCVDAKVNCTFADNKAQKLVVTYTVPKNEIAAQRTAINNKVKEIAALANKGATTEEKVQIAHDYFVQNTTYDFANMNGNIYELLVNKKGICTAYAHAFKLVLNELNIPCEMAVSNEMSHEWNVVQIDGNWYNVDLTYDVTNNGGNGNFLKSDKLFQVTGHANWVTTNGANCVDNKFDSNF